jgi:hypothetical protein
MCAVYSSTVSVSLYALFVSAELALPPGLSLAFFLCRIFITVVNAGHL